MPDTTHGNCAHGALHTAKCRQLLVWELVKSGDDVTDDIERIPDTKVVSGLLRHVELDGVDSTKVVRRRIPGCTHSENKPKASTAWNLQMTGAHLRHRRRSCGNQVDLGSCVKGNLLDNGTVRELDLKLVGPILSAPLFPFEQLQNNW